jgi:hypothetical protein
VLPMDVIFKIYIKKNYVFLSHLGFHVKHLCTLYLWLYVDYILNEIIGYNFLIS